MKEDTLKERFANADIMIEDIVSTNVDASTSTPEIFAVTICKRASVKSKIAWTDTQKFVSSGQKAKEDVKEILLVISFMLLLHRMTKIENMRGK